MSAQVNASEPFRQGELRGRPVPGCGALEPRPCGDSALLRPQLGSLTAVRGRAADSEVGGRWRVLKRPFALVQGILKVRITRVQAWLIIIAI